jgi:hypothetical protein
MTWPNTFANSYLLVVDAVLPTTDSSMPALFLNNVVDRLSSTARKGEFFARGEFVARLHRLRFTAIDEVYSSVCATWPLVCAWRP